MVPALVEVAAVVAGVNRAAGNDEPQPVDRGYLPAALALGERQLGVVVHDPSVRRGERVDAQVALRDVAQPGFAQRWVAVVDQRPVIDVAGLRDQHRAQADLEIAQLRVWFVVAGERVQELGLGRNLEHEVRQIGRRHQRIHARA
jgi:hypothetical protein